MTSSLHKFQSSLEGSNGAVLVISVSKAKFCEDNIVVYFVIFLMLNMSLF